MQMIALNVAFLSGWELYLLEVQGTFHLDVLIRGTLMVES